jgi:uncharacterized protein (DUF2267 family)
MVNLKSIDYVPHDAHRSCSLADSRTQGWRDPLTQIKVGNLSSWQLSRKKGSAAMSHTGLPAFDKTIQESNTWLKLLMEHLGTNDREYAYRVMKATLHALRDRIGPETAVHLAAQLPMLIRGMYFEGWHPASTPTHERHLEDFLEHVARELPNGLRGDPEEPVRAVFLVIWESIDQGEVGKLIKVFPSELRQLWQAPVR